MKRKPALQAADARLREEASKAIARAKVVPLPEGFGEERVEPYDWTKVVFGRAS